GPLAISMQDVFAASVGAGRPTALPYRQLVGTADDELPVNIEADAAQMDSLLHLVSDAGRTAVSVDQAAVNRDPIAEAIGVHDQLPHIFGRGRDSGRDCDDGHWDFRERSEPMAEPYPLAPEATPRVSGRLVRSVSAPPEVRTLPIR